MAALDAFEAAHLRKFLQDLTRAELVSLLKAHDSTMNLALADLRKGQLRELARAHGGGPPDDTHDCVPTDIVFP